MVNDNIAAQTTSMLFISMKLPHSMRLVLATSGTRLATSAAGGLQKLLDEVDRDSTLS